MNNKPIIEKKTTAEWKKVLREKNRAIMAKFQKAYGKNPQIIEEKIENLIGLIEHFEKLCPGNAPVGIVRVPGRLNTLGMHVDHRGSYVNPIAIQKEITLCYRASADDRIEIHNTNPEYGARSFNIDSEQPIGEIGSIDEWLKVTQQLADERIRKGTNNDWVNKVKAVPVYFGRMVFPKNRLRGFQGVCTSTIPPRSGLSSSSALLIAVFKAMLTINDLEIDYNDYARHCGIAEWFVGTRGGSGDHAAIIYSRPGMITHMKTTPELVIGQYMPFPEGYSILIFQSGTEADKTGPAGEKFNQKTATYEIGEIYLRKHIQKHHSDIFQRVIRERERLGADVKKFHLQDIVENFSQDQIYQFLLKLPKRIDRRQLLKDLPDEIEELEKQFSTHPEPKEKYPVRAVITYGIAESARTMGLKEILERGEIARYGEFMNTSHDGDRVSGLSETQARLKDNIDPQLDLSRQVGDYNCSVQKIDRMVDIALANGALGAQISGAGLGGGMMALIENKKVAELISAMNREYYVPNNIEPNYLTALPIAGAGEL